jgi:CheY-like chemotaxis protein
MAPWAFERATGVEPFDPAGRADSPESVRVLVVDDNPDMRAIARIVLERAGFEAEAVADGRRALDLDRLHPADVLITDIFMPECDGIELIALFKARHPELKIIAMSGGEQLLGKDHLPDAADIGADALLKKPFAAETLLRIVQQLVRRCGR